MKIGAIIENIEKFAPLRAQASWDFSGIQVACERREAKKIAVFLDPLPDMIGKALKAGAEFILTHHPLSLKPTLPCKANSYYHVLKMLLGADVPLYAAHTSLDVNIAGPAGWPGRALELQDLRILELECEPDYTFPAGLGYGGIGNLPAALPAEEVLRKILSFLDLEYAVLCGESAPSIIRRIAFCGGSGASLYVEAARLGADLFITGDVKYHAALDSPLPILDVGHFSIENKMMRIFADCLRSCLYDVEVIFYEGREPFQLVEYDRDKM